MHRDQEILFFHEKIKAIQYIGSVLDIWINDSEFKNRMTKLIQLELNETFINLESVLIKPVSN